MVIKGWNVFKHHHLLKTSQPHKIACVDGHSSSFDCRLDPKTSAGIRCDHIREGNANATIAGVQMVDRRKMTEEINDVVQIDATTTHLCTPDRRLGGGISFHQLVSLRSSQSHGCLLHRKCKHMLTWKAAPALHMCSPGTVAKQAHHTYTRRVCFFWGARRGKVERLWTFYPSLQSFQVELANSQPSWWCMRSTKSWTPA